MPIAAVTAAAMFGQVGFFYGEATPAEWEPAARWALAGWIAVTAESVSLYIGWHAHDALLARNFRAAARRRLASYAMALVVAGVNYWHFSDGGHPTPLAVVFALFSAISPWLWGMHTRREMHLQLIADGVIDKTGAQFAPDKWLNFPVHTFRARRYSIMHNITDPATAWRDYHADRDRRQARRRGATGAAAEPSGGAC